MRHNSREAVVNARREHEFSRFRPYRADQYSTLLETADGPLALTLTRYQLGRERVVVVEGTDGSNSFKRQISRIGSQFVLRFEDNAVGTTVHWYPDAEGRIVIHHDGRVPEFTRIDTERRRVEGPLVDVEGRVLDLQGERRVSPAMRGGMLPLLAKDPQFVDFVFGLSKVLSEGVSVSGSVRESSGDGDPVPYAKVTLRWAEPVTLADLTLLHNEWPQPENVLHTISDDQGRFEFAYVPPTSYKLQVAAEKQDSLGMYYGSFMAENVAADLVKDVMVDWVLTGAADADFGVCDIIFDGDIAGLADCYVWMIIYGPK